MKKTSNLEKYRQDREDQPSARREAIIDAAEVLFLEKGIAETTMIDIAERSGVSRMTLYRHFAERADLAVAVAGRMFDRLFAAAPARPADLELEPLAMWRKGVTLMIETFPTTRDAHRYLTMFDTLDPLAEADTDLVESFTSRLGRAIRFDQEKLLATQFDPLTRRRMLTLLHTVMGTLGRFATQGPVLISRGGFEEDEHLESLLTLALGYFDQTIAPDAQIEPAPRP